MRGEDADEGRGIGIIEDIGGEIELPMLIFGGDNFRGGEIGDWRARWPDRE